MYHGVEHQSIPLTVPTCGFFSLNGEKGLIRIKGRINSAQYISVLKRVCEVNQKKPNPEKLLIAHDWNPVHRSKAVKEFIRASSELRELDWPPNFGDVMPMERIWDKMLEEPFVEQGKLVSVSDENHLWDILVRRWNEVTDGKNHQNFVADIVRGIPKKLTSIINNVGGFTA